MSHYDQTPTFNLKAVVQETGLKPDTLRAWERRYGQPQPERTSGGHRLYSQHDIEMLKWLIARQDEGLSISRAIEMWKKLEDEGKDPFAALAGENEQEMARPSSAPIVTGGETLSDLRAAWQDACMIFDEQQAEQILAQAFALYPIETVCTELLQKALAEIGEGWYEGRVTVQQEHFASALATRRLEALLAAAPPPTRHGRILSCCPPEEIHTFSLLLLTLLLKRQGWEVIYLGANVPLARLETTISATRPDLVVASAQQLKTAATLYEMANLLRRERIPLAFGGLVFNHIPGLAARISGHFLGERLDLAPRVVEQLMISRRLSPASEPVSPDYQAALAHYQERQAQIESAIWRQINGFEHSHMSIANSNMAQNINAALLLGDISFLGQDMYWVKGLMINYNLPVEILYHYIEAYHQAAQTGMDERGKPITDWLQTLLNNGIKEG